MEQRALTQRTIFSLLLTVLTTASLQAEVNFYTNMPTEQLLPRLLTSMDDSELLGQVFLLGYAGSLPTPKIMGWITEHGLGGVKIFGWNARNIADLTESITRMQRAATETRLKIPLTVATDQEGGWVRHIQGDTSITPGNMAIGATNLPEDAFKSAYYIGRELHVLGVNMNFAPDVDILTNPHADVIGPRSFGSNPVKAGLLSVAFFKGLQSTGIIATAKHYPGHGDAAGDSHLTLPIIQASLDRIWNRDLVPYRLLVKDGLPAIMVGHLAYPKVTGNFEPASLSPYFVTEILRNRIGFKGVVVTDDLLMGGVQQTGLSLAQISERALEAGDDMLMISRTPSLDSTVWTDLLTRMRRDRAFAGIVREAAARILKMKLEYLKGPSSVPLHPSAASVAKELPDSKGENFFFEQACRATTIVKGTGIPLNGTSGEKILLVGQFEQFLIQGKLRYPDAATYNLPYSPFYYPREGEISRLLAVAEHYPIIIFGVANPNSMKVLEALKPLEKKGTKIIAFSALSPVYLRHESWVSTAIAVYGMGADSFAAGFAVLRGDFPAKGTMPISMLNGEF